MVIEALVSGREVIHTFEKLPNCHHPKSFDELVATIEKIKSNPQVKYEAAQETLDSCNTEKTADQLIAIYKRTMDKDTES
jgi:hypothetical protein